MDEQSTRMITKSLYKKSYEQFAQMKEQRGGKNRLSGEVQRFFHPELPPWDDIDNAKAGNKGNIDVYSSAPQESAGICADGIQGHLASKGMAWFSYEMIAKELNADKKIKEWLQHRSDVTYRLYADSNYYSHLNPCLLNGVTFGDAPSWMEKNREENGIACLNFYPRNVWIARDITGSITRFVHGVFQMTVLEAVDFFGLDKLSQAIKEDHKYGRLLNKYKFSHFTLLKTDPILQGEKDISDRPWVSYYCQDELAESEQKILIPPSTGGGYWTQPFSYWREREIIGMPYGWGRGCSAIISVYGVNEAARQLMISGNMAIDPAFFVPHGLKSRVDIKPRGRTYGGKNDLKPEMLYDGGKYPFGSDLHDRLRDEVYRCFDVPFFTQLRNSQRQMTAFEIAKLIEETGVLLEPKVGRFETDKLDQDHNRAFDLADQMQLADPPPPIFFEKLYELRRKYPNRTDLGRINVVYNGRLVQAMKMAKVALQADTVINQIGALAREQAAAGQVHTVWDKIDVDGFGEHLGRTVDLPEKLIRDDEQVAAIRAGREQQMMQERQLALAAAAADAAPKLSKKVEEGSPLAALAGAGG